MNLKHQPSVSNRHDSSPVLSNVQEDRLGEVKVLQRRVAPTPRIVGEGVVGWAVVGGGHNNGSWKAPLWIVHASELVARAAAEAIVEEGGAQSRGVRPVALAVQIAVATSPTCTPKNSAAQ